MINDFTIFDFNVYNFYFPRLVTEWGAYVFKPRALYIHIYKFVLFSLYYTHFIAVKSRKKKKQRLVA